MPSALYTLFFLAATATEAPGLDTAIAKLLGAPALFEQITTPETWQPVGKPAPDSTMSMRFALKQSDIRGLQAKLDDIADHESPNYGKWLTQEEVEAFTTPDAGVADKVRQWLQVAGISPDAISQTSPDWLSVEMPVNKVEQLLNTEYSLFKHDSTGHTMARTLEYSIPQDLHALIDTIQPTISFVTSRKSHENTVLAKSAVGSRAAVARDCSRSATPDCIRQLYNVDYKGQGKSFVAAACYNNDNAFHSDVPLFLQNYDPNTANTDYSDISLSDNSNPEVHNSEPSLDIQMQLSLASPNPAALIHTSVTGNFYEEILSLTDFLTTNNDAPHVVSMSYGAEEPSTSNAYTERICNEFSKATARGITILVSSGDFGVGGNSANCRGQFIPTFPSGCPYVTSVGATTLSSDGTTESAAQFNFIKGGNSGGGFSDIYGVPDWQSNDTAAYISKVTSSYDGRYSKQGRGYPDVALLGTNVAIVYNAHNYLAEGTSASAPIFAGLLTQINDYRLANGKPLLGFINKRLYTDKTVRAALRDVTSGNNANCGTTGFIATSGWDPVTGLGSVDFAALRKALSN